MIRTLISKVRNSELKITIHALAFMIAMLIWACTGNETAHEHDTYICPMHPTVISDRPSTCPVCGMDLVRKGLPGEEVEITEDLARLIKSPNEVVVSSVSTIKGVFKSMPLTVEAHGVITYDTRNVYSIPAKVGGRLEKVFLKYAFQPVRKGQKVAEIYSPELITSQRELLYLVENDPANTTLIESARKKLHLLGVTPTQVETLLRNKQASSNFSIYSQYDGYVMRDDQEIPVVPKPTSSTSTMGGGMGTSPSGTSPSYTPGMNNSAPELIREGAYVSTGQTLFKVVNPAGLRIELDLPPSEAAHVQLQDTVMLDLGNEKTLNGKVDFIQPYFNDGEEFTRVRLYVENNGELQIGQLVRASIQVMSKEALWIPREALLELGLEKIVFAKEQEVFRPKQVRAGIQSAGWVEITQGISSSDEIATNAQYMVDSESFIKVK